MRDATDNVMAIYTVAGSDSLYQSEQHLYGSSRLGIFKRNINADAVPPQGISANLIGKYFVADFIRGNKNYELSNHLGNVLATVSDKKTRHSADGTTIDYYQAEVVSANDYYPFGMAMPGRRFSLDNSLYRYGFNGQERDDEVLGSGNSYTAEFWQYDSRIGRRWNRDPKPDMSLSPYSTFRDNPILFNDVLGDTIRLYGNAEVTNTRLTDKGGVNEHAGESKIFREAKINPVYAEDNKTLVGYNVYDTKNIDFRNPVLQLEGDADLLSFKKDYSWQFGAARLYYANGDPSDGYKMVAAGMETDNSSLIWKGLKKINKESWSDPVFATQVLLSVSHMGVKIASHSSLPLKFTNTSSGNLKNFEVQGNFSATSVFNNLKKLYRGNFRVVNSSTLSTTIEVQNESVHFRVSLNMNSKTTKQSTIKFSTPNTKGEWRSREAYRFNKK